MKSKFPEWLKRRLPAQDKWMQVEEVLKDLNLNTVCQSAKCPNQGECFVNNTATFMILGKNCTRNCRFCAVNSSRPEKVDPQEPINVAEAVKKLNLRYVVITSVTRDDLKEGGVNQFIEVVKEINMISAEIKIELLTPDFQGEIEILKKLAAADFEVFNHNIETVPRLYGSVRPEADYKQSLFVLDKMKFLKAELYTKSGIMVGLGEKKEEVIEVMKDLREKDVDILTIGQYLSPSKLHLEVKEFITPELFAEYKTIGESLGFKSVVSEPFARSSYHAAESLA
ncbi:lipoic acid synthetase [Halanaerobium congolense]|jgi:lipoic acid synthetase|uniref:Lipoyl synthase n=1 Tax=Halanaerobium congolense TaxID=54121 RepID=A0A1G8RLZ3_9FIRM|nr:lipoyl synthase [Halanaerobium congolense]KXS49887.1 MAG: lipoic acid synthetase [Halanaerobium sp. T82-1]TDP16091.1 lipoic acid synthetase [Halanaerobium congolense]TDS31679.1 lipoic acid synthetase [Halanaerobium congolense]SDJ17912.1 lipoic acid synthetase [Halanaerobium congolense]SET74746.1 lipoic acid synthetase [Halanaerobium congolense]